MAIYKGTSKVGISGIGKAFFGSNLVYQKTVASPLCFEWLNATSNNYLYFSITGTISAAIQYKINDGEWIDWDGSRVDTTSPSDKIYVQNTSNTLGTSLNKYLKFAASGTNIKISGNCNSMINYKNVSDYCFVNLFMGMNVVDITELSLPSKTVANSCYYKMFDYCNALTSIPSGLLPATTLADYCYNSMFSRCSRLLTIGSNLLPATSLANYCYIEMFRNCSLLNTPPNLPATVLTDGCYFSMFNACSALKVNNNGTGTLFLTFASSGSMSTTAMFNGTGGSYTDVPVAGGMYYYE